MSLWRVLLAVLASAATTAAAAATQDCHATAFIGTAYRDRSGTDYSVKAEIAAYADGYAAPATGELVRAGDGFADMGCSLPWKQPVTGPWIALVRRGGCSVELKIANAVHQGANGLIIYNNRDSLSLQNLRVTRKYQTLISVVFTYKWKGEELTALLDFGTKIVAEISVANPCIAVSDAYERNMQLVSISFLCFIVLTISLAWLIFYYVQRHRDIQARIRKARGYSEADEKALKAIPTKTLKPSDKLLKDEFECCAICIDPYKQSEVVRTLVCGHEFHKDCIDPWLLENRTCPMCKKDILGYYGSVFLGSQESIIQVVADEAHRLAGPSSAIQVVVVANRRALTPSPMPSPMRSQMTSPVNSELEILTERVQPMNRDAVCFAESCSSLLTVDSAHEALHLIDSVEETSKTGSVTSNYAQDTCKYPQTSKTGLQSLGTGLETPSTSIETSNPTQSTPNCTQDTSAYPQTSKTAEGTSKTGHATSNFSQGTCKCPQTSQTGLETLGTSIETSNPTQSTSSYTRDPSTYPQTSKTAEETSKTAVDTSNSPQEISYSAVNVAHSLLDSCQELRETDDEPIETRPMRVDENDNPLTTDDDAVASNVEKDGLLEKSSNESTTAELENS